jgi:neuroligin
VTTKYGSLRGITISVPNRSLQPIEAFLGVPYASSPLGKLRFMPPVTPDVWTGIRTVDRHASVCPQTLTPSINLLHRFRSDSSLSTSQSLQHLFNNETQLLKIMTPERVQMHQKMKQLLQNQSEDCLYLNIYVPVSGEFYSFFAFEFAKGSH